VTITQEPWTPPQGWPPESVDFMIPKFVEDAMANIVKAYASDYPHVIPLPERQYWTIGTTAHDCEQMVLAVQQMFLGTAENPIELTLCTGPRGLTFTVEVVRCVPGLTNRGQPPPADSIEVASVHPVIDMEILVDLAKYFDPYSTGVIVNVDPIPANGGFHGAIATYSVTL
jgi:hypothetical protein